VQELAISDGRNREVERIFNMKKRERIFNLPLARNGGTIVARSGEEGTTKAR